MVRGRSMLMTISVLSIVSLAACGSAGDVGPAGGTSGVGGGGSSAGSGGGSSDAGGASANGSADASAVSGSEQFGSSPPPPATLDAQTVTWFTTACSGMTPPLRDMASTLASLDFDEPASAQVALAKMYATMSDDYRTAASKLSPVPPPTFAKGPAIATRIVKEMRSSVGLLKQTASTIAGADDSGGTELQQAVQAAEDSSAVESGVVEPAMDRAKNGILLPGDLELAGGLTLDEATQEAVLELPTCRALQAASNKFEAASEQVVDASVGSG